MGLIVSIRSPLRMMDSFFHSNCKVWAFQSHNMGPRVSNHYIYQVEAYQWNIVCHHKLRFAEMECNLVIAVVTLECRSISDVNCKWFRGCRHSISLFAAFSLRKLFLGLLSTSVSSWCPLIVARSWMVVKIPQPVNAWISGVWVSLSVSSPSWTTFSLTSIINNWGCLHQRPSVYLS